jgi:REP element-mobilizing transposase RayT
MQKLKERRSNRLQEYDYSKPGYYYATICTHNRIEWFGTIRNNKMILNDHGHLCESCWTDLPNHYDSVSCDKFVIMPNHIHGILIIDNVQREGYKPSPTPSYKLSEIIRGFKTFSAKRINEKIANHNCFKWQRSFYDHVIRKGESLHEVRTYIENNPATWLKDNENVGTGLQPVR